MKLFIISLVLVIIVLLLEINKPPVSPGRGQSVDTAKKDYLALGGKLDNISTGIEQNNLALAQLIQAQSRDTGSQEDSYLPLDAMDNSIVAGQQSLPEAKNGKQPKILLANATPEQNESYEVLKARLDDPLFLSDLSLEAFAESEEMQSLPKPLQLVLIQKAIDQYNNGYVNAEIFLGHTMPNY